MHSFANLVLGCFDAIDWEIEIAVSAQCGLYKYYTTIRLCCCLIKISCCGSAGQHSLATPPNYCKTVSTTQHITAQFGLRLLLLLLLYFYYYHSCYYCYYLPTCCSCSCCWITAPFLLLSPMWNNFSHRGFWNAIALHHQLIAAAITAFLDLPVTSGPSPCLDDSI